MRSVIECHIISFLKSTRNKAQFTSAIARGIARDEEFTKQILESMRRRKLLLLAGKRKDGQPYKARQAWKLSSSGLKG